MNFLLNNRRHLGLGDLIVLNGAIRELAKQHDVYLFCYKYYLTDAQMLFGDNPKIQFLTPDVTDLSYMDCGIDLGDMSESFRGNSKNWAEGFYKQLGIPYDKSYDSFQYCQLRDQWEFPDPIIFYHEDRPRYMHLDYKTLQEAEKRYPGATFVSASNYTDKPLLSWVETISKAKEIHVIDSCFVHLVERFPTTGKLFLHHYARTESAGEFFTIPLKKSWDIIK